jgi:hypothetical protein
MRTTAQVRAEIEEQPRLEPGIAGWWKVYGATPRSIRPGDYVMTPDSEFYVQDTYEFSVTGIRIGIVVDGERQSIGCLYGPIVLLRQGVKATLDERAR